MITTTCTHLLLDLDGVLVNSTAVVERVWSKWAAQHGLDAQHVLRIAHGRPTVETVKALAPHLDVLEEASRLTEWELRDTSTLVPIPGAETVLASVRPSDYAVVTSGSRALAQSRLTSAGLAIPRVLVTADDVTCGKPDPEAYRLAAEHLQVSPASCLVVEDSPAGIKAGKSAGMRVLGVATTHSIAELSEADHLTNDLRGIAVDLQTDGTYCIGITEAVT